MLPIHPEPFKLFTESENAVGKSQYQNAIILRENQCLVNHSQLTLSCFAGFNRQVGGSSEEI